MTICLWIVIGSSAEGLLWKEKAVVTVWDIDWFGKMVMKNRPVNQSPIFPELHLESMVKRALVDTSRSIGFGAIADKWHRKVRFWKIIVISDIYNFNIKTRMVICSKHPLFIHFVATNNLPSTDYRESHDKGTSQSNWSPISPGKIYGDEQHLLARTCKRSTTLIFIYFLSDTLTA